MSRVVVMALLLAGPALGQDPVGGNPIDGALVGARVLMELKTHARQVHNLERDMRRLRQDRRALDAQRRFVATFFSGDSTGMSLAKFRMAIHQLEQTPAMTRLLRCSVPPLEGHNFKPDAGGLAADLFDREGNLAPPPLALAGRCPTSPVKAARVEFESVWRQVAWKLRAGEAATPEDYVSLQQAVGRWAETAKSEVAEMSPLDRCLAEAHMRRVAALVEKLKSPAEVERLRRALEGYCFSGGTTADLIDHLLKNRLGIRYGSEAHLRLQELGAEYVRQLDDQIACLDERMEGCKSRSPAYTASLSQWAAGQSPGMPANGKIVEPSAETVAGGKACESTVLRQQPCGTQPRSF